MLSFGDILRQQESPEDMSLETISFKKDSSTFLRISDELIGLVKEICTKRKVLERTDPNSNERWSSLIAEFTANKDLMAKIVSESKYGKSLAAELGSSNLVFLIDTVSAFNAYCAPFSIQDAAFSIGDYEVSSIGTSMNVDRLLNILAKDDPKHNRHIVGGIDLKEGKLLGDFKKIPFELALGVGYLDQILKMYVGIQKGEGDKKKLEEDMLFTARCCTAVMLHELGHAFTSLEQLLLIGNCMGKMQAVTNALNGLTDTSYKLKLIKAAAFSMGIESLNDSVELSKESNDVIVTRLITGFLEERKLSSGYHIMDVTACENVADQFVARYNAGYWFIKHRVNDQLPKTKLSTSYMKAASKIREMALRSNDSLLKKLFNPFADAIFFIGISFIVSPFDKKQENNNRGWGFWYTDINYDSCYGRAKRVLREMIARLKTRNLPPQELREHIGQIEEIIELLDKNYDNIKGSISFLRSVYLNKKNRLNFAREMSNILLENLSDNKLYLSAAKLSTLLK